ncbi:MAG: PIN domain-containing protein [Deltaproteobacteria bacterium]|nr:PIN domain-containing protein [Deltaproteobacteria bacterium]
MAQIVLDTNILIEILKNNTQTLRAVEGLNGELCISAISVMELYFGARDKAELSKYAKSHYLDIPDALIASSVLINNIPLMTYNRKDFKYIEGLKLLN